MYYKCMFGEEERALYPEGQKEKKRGNSKAFKDSSGNIRSIQKKRIEKNIIAKSSTPEVWRVCVNRSCRM